jgi:indolepyruvate ferredoxin oxidoreductase, beta subunit
VGELVHRPVCLLIGALGGEGGGVLADWLTEAATAEGYPVQRTSVPGVAQRTGATTYYLEILPTKRSDLGGKQPVFALFPNPGTLDLVVATEILEAGRAMERGFVTPDRTTLIASTHRIFAIAEKSVPADGRYDSDRIVAAANELAKQPILFDINALTREKNVSLNAVLLGMIAGAGVLPFGEDVFRGAVHAAGKAVAENLKGFEIGLAAVREPPKIAAVSDKRATTQPSPLTEQAHSMLPAALHAVAHEALPRLTRFQNKAYAERWIARAADLAAAEQRAGVPTGTVTVDAARHLAVWMSFEDIIRVAEVKSRGTRRDQLMQDVGAKPGQVVRVTEFLKPGIPEWADMLPPGLGRRLRGWAERRGNPMNIGLQIRSDTVLGFLTLYMLARLRWWRPRTLRFAEENADIDAWLSALKAAMGRDAALAREIAELPRLRKGYGETRTRGVGKYTQVMAKVVIPWLAGTPPNAAAARLKRVRLQALSDSDDAKFDAVLLETADASTVDAAKAAAE